MFNDVTKMNDEELIKYYEHVLKSYEDGWSKCQDGSAMAYWCLEVEPTKEEMQKRGLL